MINISNRNWHVTWDEQNDQFIMVPQFRGLRDKGLILTGREAKELKTLISAAMALPNGNREEWE